jgi:hypothetical protein
MNLPLAEKDTRRDALLYDAKAVPEKSVHEA